MTCSANMRAHLIASAALDAKATSSSSATTLARLAGGASGSDTGEGSAGGTGEGSAGGRFQGAVIGVARGGMRGDFGRTGPGGPPQAGANVTGDPAAGMEIMVGPEAMMAERFRGGVMGCQNYG